MTVACSPEVTGLRPALATRAARPYIGAMAKKKTKGAESAQPSGEPSARPAAAPPGRPSSLVDTRVVYCGDNLDQLRKLPDACVDLITIDPPFNSNRNYEVFWGETREKRAFEDRHASTAAYIDFMRPRCVRSAFGCALCVGGGFPASRKEWIAYV